ncbi:helix-turn-helix transcriptional regulator [Phenylobacterium sp.]|uniref:helix-turn-helix domain-containing protein n=1 Tax=Phenylobacterium sp. TaxID=1871053 RepID=UPI0025CD15FA|nr:helix-turn-helix transcriptional regulator [Phenylobacterium sp.]
MAESTDIAASRSATLSQALRRLRHLRGLRPGEMADAMGMQRRTYEYFEAGRGKINVDRIHQFARVLDVDPYAILAAVEIRSPGFAVACAEQKLMTVFMVNLQEFDAKAKETVARLNTATVVAGFTRMFDALAREAAEGEDFLGARMGEGDRWTKPSAELPNGDRDGPEDDPEAAADT